MKNIVSSTVFGEINLWYKVLMFSRRKTAYKITILYNNKKIVAKVSRL